MRKIHSLYFRNIADIYRNYVELNFKRLTNSPNSTDIEDLRRKFEEFIPENSGTFPLVVLIGGVAGSGKSSFINFCRDHMAGVFEESTVDCCRVIASYMSELEGPDNVVFQSAISQKTEGYRTLLSKLKKIWCEFDDGPNTITIQSIKCIWENEPSASVVFVNVREPSQIEHLKKRIECEMDAVVLTLAVLRNGPDESMNESDQHTLEYAYDLWIKNSMCLEDLEIAAIHFCNSIDLTNKSIGILCNDLAVD